MRAYTRVIAVAMLLCGGPFAHTQQPAGSPTSSPLLSVSDIEHGLKGGVTNTRMAMLVKQYGVDFELTDAIKKQLRAAGASDELLLRIARTPRSAQGTPPPDRQGKQGALTPADSAPSLEATMKFIQDKMNSHGTVSYAWTHNKLSSGTLVRSDDTIADVGADRSACTLRVLEKRTIQIQVTDGNTYYGSTGDDLHRESLVRSTIPVRDINSVAVESRQSSLNREVEREGIIYSFTPDIYQLSLKATTKDAFSFRGTVTTGKQLPRNLDSTGATQQYMFRDEQIANRIAKAILHAVEFCGGSATYLDPGQQLQGPNLP